MCITSIYASNVQKEASFSLPNTATSQHHNLVLLHCDLCMCVATTSDTQKFAFVAVVLMTRVCI